MKTNFTTPVMFAQQTKKQKLKIAKSESNYKISFLYIFFSSREFIYPLIAADWQTTCLICWIETSILWSFSVNVKEMQPCQG